MEFLREYLDLRETNGQEVEESCFMIMNMTFTLYYSQDAQINTYEMGWSCSTGGLWAQYAYRVLFINHEGKRSRTKPKHRLEDSIKNLRYVVLVGLEKAEWINLAHNMERQ